ncbi:PREDICTED: leiomodin-1 isoform X1 [Sturnus vulgaris]|uniref:leiomodin-1 isoform X1 n=1 Tax=Sturnus vulgaris TaxID=9172 RepID=UPI00071A9CC0|nr:PREDICTED: leiomodin-1 isoform X1 [Sturnus vulgaris]
MSKVAKYRRQVSEDPDIDNLLSTLSPEEMEELEKELDVVDADGSISVERSQTNQSENSSPAPRNCDTALNHHDKDTRRLLQREHSIDESRLSKNKGDKNQEEKGKESPSKDLAQKRDTKVGKDSKKEEKVQKTEPKGKAETETKSKENKAMNDKVKAMEKKLMGKDRKEEEKGSVLKDKGKDKKEEEKSSELKKDAGKDKKEEENSSSFKKKDVGKDKKEEEKVSAAKEETEKEKKQEKDSASKDTGKDIKEEKSSESKKQAEKDIRGEGKKENYKKEDEKASVVNKSKADEKDKSQAEAEKTQKAEEKQEAKAGAGSSPSKPSSSSSADQAKDDEASSIFDELIEKVKNNDAEVTEVNVNNSDCINNETLVRFTEALEFNTVVKVFALANTRADDHVAFAIAIMLKSNKVLTSINLDSNHITGKGILAIFRALLQNNTLTELRFHNQRHICGGKTEMEIAKLLKENTTLLKLGYHFELAGPRMTVTNLLSRNMDRQRQKRLQEQKLAQERGEKKDLLEVPKPGALPKGSPKASPQPSPKASPKSSPKKGGAPTVPPPPPPPLAPPLMINENLKNSLSPATQRKLGDRALPVQEKNSRDQLLAAIRSSNLKQLKKVQLPKLLQ